MLCQSIVRILCLILSLLDFEIVGKDSTEQQLYLHLHPPRCPSVFSINHKIKNDMITTSIITCTYLIY